MGWLAHVSTRIGEWFKSVRDWALLASAFLYGLGYITWSLYAWSNDLGVLPLLSTQYVLAGLMAGTLGIIGIVLICLIWWLRRLLRSWPSHRKWKSNSDELVLSIGWLLRQIRNVSFVIFFVAGFAFNRELRGFVIAFGVAAFFAPPPVVNFRWLRLAYVACLRRSRLAWLRKQVWPLIYVEQRSRQRKSRNSSRERYVEVEAFWQLASYAYGVFFTLFIIVMSLAAVADLFDAWPQELGGAKPRCTYLDLERAKISNELSGELVGDSGGVAATAPLQGPVLRTMKLDMLFSGGGAVLVRKQTAHRRDTRPIYEIDQRIILAKRNCE
jgi:hypothetical protein